jgi:hypothetical protein
MTGQEVYEARQDLGYAWGLGRPLFAAELGRVLKLTGREPGQQVLRWEAGKARVPGPAEVALQLMLRGSMPAGVRAGIRKEQEA